MSNIKIPVEVNVNLESLEVSREAFYNLCFITESDTAPRNVNVQSLKELLDNGYDRESLAYNFCVGVFSQRGISSVTIRAKRSSESYIKAYDSADNSQYYFLTIQTKSEEDILELATYLQSQGQSKLLFYSNDKMIKLPNTVAYYQEKIPLNTPDSQNRVPFKYFYINKAYKLGHDARGLFKFVSKSEYVNKLHFVFLGELDISLNQRQQAITAYPEASWIAECANKFPSEVQWLYKSLAKTGITPISNIPTGFSASSIVNKNKVTMGSGCTTEGVPIQEEIMLDWVKWGISQKVWNTLYTKERITNKDKDLIVNDVRNVLDIAVSRGSFEKYKITDISIQPRLNSISIKFDAHTTQTILGTEVSGSLGY